MATPSQQLRPACSYVVGEDGLNHWSQVHADAWIGLLQTHRELVRALDAELYAEHNLSLSSLELLGRLAASEGRVLRLSNLAAQAGLSLSRVSRVVDDLELRGLVERFDCPGDRRARNARLTDAGSELLRAAQATHFEGVQRRFFDRLDADEIAVLSSIFKRFSSGATANCA